ncbi:hypothetical protein ACQPYA_03240 [Micromonospora sp. CA-263727]|uniref:hypothetical protein n=1 Tax=Micromonospora sp. CA-263727 TaxID=3239967 RepID=UPI003D92A400
MPAACPLAAACPLPADDAVTADDGGGRPPGFGYGRGAAATHAGHPDPTQV